MILSTFHASNSSAPLIKPKLPQAQYEDCIPLRTTINTFNEHLVSAEAQSLICDFLETVICNEERIRHLRETLINDKDFDPINLFQIITRSHSANNTLNREILASYVARPVQDLKLLFPGYSHFTLTDFTRLLFVPPTEDDCELSAFFTAYDKKQSSTQVLRQIDLQQNQSSTTCEEQLKDLIRYMIECARQEEALKVQIKSECRDFNLRKVYQVCFLTIGGVQTDKDRVVTGADVKRFFTANGRIMETGRIERSLFRVAAQCGSSGEQFMDYEGFARLFCSRGKLSIVSYPTSSTKRWDTDRIERDVCKDTLKSSINTTNKKLPVNKVHKDIKCTAAIVSSDRSKENTLNGEKIKNKRPHTSDFKTKYVTPEAIIGFFFQTYIPEQILLDDELERLRIACVANLCKEKASILGLYSQCLGLTVNHDAELVCSPKDVYNFLKSYPIGISKTLDLDEIEFMFGYYLEREPTGNGKELTFNQLIERLLRPQSEDFSQLLDQNIKEYTISEYIPMSDTSKETLASFLLSLSLNCQRNLEIRRTYLSLTKSQGSSVLKFLSNHSSASVLNPEEEAVSYDLIQFKDFIEYARTRGGLSNLGEKEVQYLCKRYTENVMGKEVIRYREFERDIVRWL